MSTRRTYIAPPLEPSPWENPIYSNDQIDKLAIANRNLIRTGYPQRASKLVQQMRDSVPFSEINVTDEFITSNDLRPETPIDITLVDIPPRHGKGSGHDAWAEFASLVSDMDTEVIDQFGRNEIISILEDRDIINAEPEGAVLQSSSELIEEDLEK